MKASIASSYLLLAVGISSTFVAAAPVQARSIHLATSRGANGKVETRSLGKSDLTVDHTERSSSVPVEELESRFSWSPTGSFTPGQIVSTKSGSKHKGSGEGQQTDDDQDESQPHPRSLVDTTWHATGSSPEQEVDRRDHTADKRFSIADHLTNVAKYKAAHGASSSPISGRSLIRSQLRKRFSIADHMKNVAKFKAAHGESSNPMRERASSSDDGFFAFLRRRFDFWVHMENVKKWNDEHGTDPVINPIGHRDLPKGAQPLKKRFDFWVHMQNVKKWDEEHGAPVINPIGSRDVAEVRSTRPPPPPMSYGPRDTHHAGDNPTMASLLARFDFKWKFLKPGHGVPLGERALAAAKVD